MMNSDLLSRNLCAIYDLARSFILPASNSAPSRVRVISKSLGAVRGHFSMPTIDTDHELRCEINDSLEVHDGEILTSSFEAEVPVWFIEDDGNKKIHGVLKVGECEPTLNTEWEARLASFCKLPDGMIRVRYKVEQIDSFH